ncbi:hypothetical protein PENTCL1PPCAC_25128 [Pristionchus entomophagus]|uniref:Enhancer of polycomb-like protein n=1 Tax=Pristionchus entomophagus TaxID=358040 RepID=A0AAV5U990_9BILA|nr:hypothetical protein PENTCL1PPCAC_25128 [Pristionchus entomophagus]
MFSLLFPCSDAFSKRGATNLWCSAFAEFSLIFRDEEDEEDIYLISMGHVNRQRLMYQHEECFLGREEEESSAAKFFLWACLWREIETLWIEQQERTFLTLHPSVIPVLAPRQLVRREEATLRTSQHAFNFSHFRTSAMYEPYSHLVRMGRVASNPDNMDLSINQELEDDFYLKERTDKRRVSFSIPIDFLDALERLKDPTLPHYSGRLDADARGELSTCQEVEDFFYSTCDPTDLKALSVRVDAELVRNDWMMRKAMLLDLWRRTARKYANRNRKKSRQEAEADPYAKYIIHDNTCDIIEIEEKKETKERMKKRSVYYLTQLFQYAVRRMIWDRRRSSSSSDPWDTFFYHAYAAKKPTEESCARAERRKRPRVELVLRLTVDLIIRVGPFSGRSSSIIIDPATVVAMEMERARKHSSESSSDDEAEQPPGIIERGRRQSLSDLMIRKRKEAALAALDAAPELLQPQQPQLQLAVPPAEPEHLRRPAEAATAARPRRPSRPAHLLQQQQKKDAKREEKQPAFAIMKQEEREFKRAERRDKPRVPFLPPINPAPCKRSTTINLPVSMSRSRSSPNCTSRMRFGRPPHSPDGRNQLTRLFYLPLIPPRTTGSNQWPGHDIDRVIRALAS